MNKVITVNLNGSAFQLEEAGYDALRTYLDAAGARLAGNPDRDEILTDIEQAIADKFRARLGAYKNVVTTSQAAAVIAEMGPVDSGEDAGDAATTAAGSQATNETGPAAAARDDAKNHDAAKRLYRIYDGAMISGVCNGIAAYFNIDATIVRLVFILLAALTAGGAALAYLAMVFLVPVATSDAEKSAAHGTTSTAQEFIRRAKAGYYEGMKSFPDEKARREWQRKFKREMRAWGHSFQGEVKRGTQQWQENWQRYWTEHPYADSGWGIVLPFVTIFHALLALACVLAIVSLLTRGSVLGMLLPDSIPIWLAIVLVLIAYGIVTLPLKSVRHMFYHRGRFGGSAGPRVFVSFWDSLVWLAFVGVLIWLAYQHIPLVTEAFQAIPAVLGDMIDAIRDWWHQR